MDKKPAVPADDALPTRSYSSMADNPGVGDLVTEMRRIQEHFDLDSVAIAQRLPDRHLLKLTLNGPALLTIERDDGWSMIASPETLC